MLQRDLYQKLRDESARSREQLTALLRPLDSSRLHEHLEPGRWSLAQVLEHLCITDEIYDKPLAKVMHGNRPDAGAPAREWKPSFLGKLIAESLERTKPIKAPRVFQPGAAARPAVIEAFLAREAAFIPAMDAAASYDWRAVKVPSPALPPLAPKMNLGDVFRIHAVHVTRHARQLEGLVGLLRAC